MQSARFYQARKNDHSSKALNFQHLHKFPQRGTGNALRLFAMRLAIPHWQNRVSPVLDVAGALLLVDVDRGQVTSRQGVTLEEENPLGRAKRIRELDINVLICGAISWPLERALTSAGIDVIAQICGEVDQVVMAFLTGQLDQEAYLMPGCCGLKRRMRRACQGGKGRD